MLSVGLVGVSIKTSTYNFANNDRVILVINRVGPQGPTGNTGPT